MEYRKFMENGKTKYMLFGANGGVFNTYIAMIAHMNALRSTTRT